MREGCPSECGERESIGVRWARLFLLFGVAGALVWLLPVSALGQRSVASGLSRVPEAKAKELLKEAEGILAAERGALQEIGPNDLRGSYTVVTAQRQLEDSVKALSVFDLPRASDPRPSLTAAAEDDRDAHTLLAGKVTRANERVAAQWISKSIAAKKHAIAQIGALVLDAEAEGTTTTTAVSPSVPATSCTYAATAQFNGIGMTITCNPVPRGAVTAIVTVLGHTLLDAHGNCPSAGFSASGVTATCPLTAFPASGILTVNLVLPVDQKGCGASLSILVRSGPRTLASGKVVAPVRQRRLLVVHATADGKPFPVGLTFDPDKLTLDELRVLEQMLAKAQPGGG